MGNKAVEIRNLSHVYPDGAVALTGVTLNIYEGESVAVIGPNGAGKTTLLLHLNGLLTGSGYVSIFGLPIERENLKEIRKNVGLVFQDPEDQLFMPTVFEDVAFGPVNMGFPKERVAEDANSALKAVDMAGSEKRLSHHLSLGEKKRVAIATVLSMRPRLLVLDEPTSNLDPRHRRDLMKLLKGLRLTKVIATHDMDLALGVSSRAILFDKGRVIADGDAAGILSNKLLLEGHSLEVPPSIACRSAENLPCLPKAGEADFP